MTPFRLILRSLLHFRAASAAVVAGMAVATAVLTGALMVGDSVRGSLRALAVQRLGPVDYALAGPRFFDDSLAARIATTQPLGGRYDVAPMVSVTGGAAVGEGPNRRRTGGVQIMAAGGNWVPGVATEPDTCVLNGETAAALGAKAGDSRVVFTFPSMTDTPREAAVARRGVEDATASLAANRVTGVASDPGFASLFNLAGGQRVPLNAWVYLKDLEDAVGQPGRANVLLVREKAGGDLAKMSRAHATAAGIKGTAELSDALKQVVALGDYGLDVRRAGKTDESMLTARGTYLPPAAVDSARATAKAMGVTPRLVTVNLVNAVVKLPADAAAAAATRPAQTDGARVAEDRPPSPGTPGEGGGEGSRAGPAVSTDSHQPRDDPHPNPLPDYRARESSQTTATGPASQPTTAPAADGALHYVIGAGISSLDDAPLAPDEIALNTETADQLGAKVGDRLRLDYFTRESAGELREVRSTDLGFTFRVVRILPMSGLGNDPSLTPNYKGLTDAPSVSGWDPPKELGITGDRLKLAERDNDAYWKKYKAAPRLFINLDTARKLWGGPYGDVTSVRLPLGNDPAKVAEFKDKLKAAIDPAAMGFTFRPVKAEQLAAASGGTDFSELFLYFSFFLIAAAALLVAMLFRLGIEQRARQMGVLAAVGFGPWRLRGVALLEGMTLAAAGGLIGLALAVGYTWLIVYGLRTWWVGAVGTTALRLYVDPLTLVYGLAGSLLVAFFAVLWGVWRVGKVAPARLLAGAFGAETPGKVRTGRVARLIGAAVAGIGLLVLALVMARLIKDPNTALVGGGLLLCGGLTWLAGWLRPHRHAAGGRVGGMSSVTTLGVRNASRHTARSVLSVGLIAFAAFTLLTVAAFRRNDAGDTGDPKSGTGGYRLLAQAGVPVLADLNTPAGREQAGFREPNDPLWRQTKFVQLRRWAGQDISCLNLTRPDSPTILGVPSSLVEQNRFAFGSTLKKADNPWTLLDGEADPNKPDDVPVITDAETAEFILKLSVGGTMPITDQTGRRRNLRLVATLSHSIFQGEMLMSEPNFRRLFPAQAGFGTILVDAPADKVDPVRQSLNNELDPYAVTVETTAGRLATYKEIVNTYLSTFQVLGSLGLALGSIGLAVVLVRNVIERRPELALLAALGFRPGSRVWLVLAENAFLLMLGLVVGAACALLGILPTVLKSTERIALAPVGLTLLGVLGLGFLASALAVWASGVRVTPGDLRSE